jgi:glycosyltransferase involved in cell wall biosynthesis
MRLVIDGSGLAGGSADRGVGTYLRQLVEGLSRRSDTDLVVLAPSGTALPEGTEHLVVRRAMHYRVGPWLHDRSLPGELRRARAEVAHSPAFTPPRKVGTPWVQTLLDLTPFVFPHPLLAAEADRWARLGGRLREADAVIAISASSAAQGVRHLGLDPSRVHVVPLGVGAEFSAGSRTPEAVPSVLFVSSWGPHKGLREAVAVLDSLVDAGFPHRLKVIGRNDPWMQARVEEDLLTSRHRDRIDVVGWVPDLAQAYRDADALLVTSRAEGFGLPAAEAMACGTPVVAFDNTSLPEVVGASPSLVPDGDVLAFAEAVKLLLRNPRLHEEEAERGVLQAATFTWQHTVAGHAEVFASVVAER